MNNPDNAFPTVPAPSAGGQDMDVLVEKIILQSRICRAFNNHTALLSVRDYGLSGFASLHTDLLVLLIAQGDTSVAVAVIVVVPAVSEVTLPF